MITKSMDTITQFTGKRPIGWLGPGLTQTFETPDLLAAAGVKYVGDFPYDDEPTQIKTAHGPLMTLPYTVENNDIPMMIVQHHEGAYWTKKCTDTFDQYYLEASERPKILSIAIHPYISGQPFRIAYLKQVYDYINQACRRLLHKGLWAGAYGRFTIHTVGGCITWPRQIETIEAVADCCGVGTVRNQWFEFQETGYGLLNGNQVCVGKQLIDRGTVVSYRDMSGGLNSYLRVYPGDASDVGKTITLQGVDQNGQWIRTQSGGAWIDGGFHRSR